MKKRSVLPAVYNANRTRYDWNPPEPPEESCNRTVHVKMEKQIDDLQSKLERLQRQACVNDIDPVVLDDLQQAVLEDNDDDEGF